MALSVGRTGRVDVALLAVTISIAVLVEMGTASAQMKLRLRSSGAGTETIEVSGPSGTQTIKSTPASTRSKPAPLPPVDASARTAVDQEPAATPAISKSESAPSGAPPAGPVWKGQPAPQRRPEPEPVEAPPHPLAVANPDHNVITCIAGCYDEPGRVVHFKKRVAIAPAETEPRPRGGIEPAMLTAPAPEVKAVAPANQGIQCVAGCYDTPRAAAPGARASLGSDHSGAAAKLGLVRDGVGDWLTTVSREGRQPVRLQPRRSVRNGQSGEWFRRRFETPQAP
jgi:hypothetical protein